MKRLFLMLVTLVGCTLILNSCSEGKTNISEMETETSNVTANIQIAKNDPVTQFCESLAGVWADLENDCSSDNTYVVFDYCYFNGKEFQTGRYGGHTGRTGEIQNIVDLSNGIYLITLCYPEINDEMYGHLKEETFEYEMKVLNNTFYFIDYPDVIYTFMGDDFDSASAAVKGFCEETREKIYLNYINTSAQSFFEDYYYSGGNYIEWETYPFNSQDSSIYNLTLTGNEKGYKLYEEHRTITVRGDNIIGFYQDGIQVSEIKNVYQLFKWFGGDEQKLLDVTPEIIFEDQYSSYLKWEAENGYLVIYSTWYDGLSDWKESKPWSYCIFTKY
ncbi:MAG: hypothetical protein IJW06_01500 [Clostridia bacterium]|nr:hypothetical protein [Clostridia bacterium]